jgi:putative heme-binding domain-containing protein
MRQGMRNGLGFMNVRAFAFGVAGLLLLGNGSVQAQDRSAADSAESLRTGAVLFRERCAECHGSDGKGVPGHDLTRLWASGAADDRVFQTIRSGVPNTLMPSSTAPDEELWSLVQYLRSLNAVASTEIASGDVANGDRIFWAMCGSCHAVSGRGGRLGPDLSQIAQSQSRAQLTLAIRSASDSTPAGYLPVTLVTRDGRRIRGALKSEDAFSIRIMDTQERLQGYMKSTLNEIIRETGSLMPEFDSNRLNESDLNDLLAFLSTLRTQTSSRP